MKLKFIGKTLDLYSTMLCNNVSITMKINDVYDFSIEDGKRILTDFPNDFCIINNISSEINNAMPQAKIKYIIVNKRNNVLF